MLPVSACSRAMRLFFALFALILSAALAVGCGIGRGAYLNSLSPTNFTIDVGESVVVNAQVSGNPPLTWSLSGDACPNACGSISSSSGNSTTYTAPGTLTTPIAVKLTAVFKSFDNEASTAISVQQKPSLADATLQAGMTGTAYTATPVLKGGAAPFAWTLASGSLPAGLQLDASSGTLSGTPSKAGTYTFALKVTDASVTKVSSQANYSITVTDPAAALNVVYATQAQGTVGKAYTSTITATGGVTPYTFSISGGALPAGITMNAATGMLSGTPSLAGAYPFTVQVLDSAGTHATADFSTVIVDALKLVTTALPDASLNTAYTSTLNVTGGVAPYACSIASGTLPAGLTLSGCIVSGTPTISGSATLTVSVADKASPANTTSGTVTLKVKAADLQLTTTLPDATVGTTYNASVSATGGTAPYNYTASGSLPAGLSLSSSGTISGTPLTAGVSNFTVLATDSQGATANATATITVHAAALAINTTSLPNGTMGQPYSAPFNLSGGTTPYNCSFASGTLPAGLTLSNCTISGTPTTYGTVNLLLSVSDTSSPVQTATKPLTLTINPSALTLGSSTLPSGTENVAYSQALAISGGVAPYTCSITSGALQAGLTLNGCTISGTPTAHSTATLGVQVTDSASTPASINGTVSLTINAAALAFTIGTLPNATLNTPYSQTIAITGGTAPYTCAISNGALPIGLSISGCTVSGTPTVRGVSNFTVIVTDSDSPVRSASAPMAITVDAQSLSISTGTLPHATVNAAYTATIPVTGGVSPYTCTISNGTLPNGLSVANCTISGTPTVAGSSVLTVNVNDAQSPAATTSATLTLVVDPAALSIDSGGLPHATEGTAYTATIPVTGGVSPYTCTLTSGTLPAGLSISNCTVSGTPSANGTANLTVKVTDSQSTPAETTANVDLVVDPAALAIGAGGLPHATQGVAYSQTIPVTGGVSPYTCTLTSGTLPAGLSISNCTVSGTPTVYGTANLTVKVTDSQATPAAITSNIALVVDPADLNISASGLPHATEGTAYNQTIPVTGGISPYTCTLTSGTLPAGLSISNCTVSGTPTTHGSSSLTVKVTDSQATPAVITSNLTLVVDPKPLALSSGTLPAATKGTAYSETIPVTGGISPYTCSLASGSLPAGLTMTNCTVSGTPTAIGSSNFSVSVQDAASPANTLTSALSLTVNAAPLQITSGTLPTGTQGSPYTGTIPVSGGEGPYTCSVSTGTLPAGLTLDAATCTISGTPTGTGTTTVTVTVTDSQQPPQSTSSTVTITINPATLTLDTSALVAGKVNQAYSASAVAHGGVAPFTYTLASGALPAGLTLAANGTVSGTPTTVQTATFSVKVADSQNPVVTTTSAASINITAATLTIGNTTLPAATQNSPYTGSIDVQGGTAPYTCALASGTLPTGLTLSGCTITGTPTAYGTSTFDVQVTDGGSPQQTVTSTITLTVNPAALTISASGLPHATQGTAYNQTIPVTGGISPYTCTLTSGTLPAGLSISNCTVSGTPSANGTANLTVKVTDSQSTPAETTANVDLVVDPAALNFGVSISSLPAATLGVAYTGSLNPSGGVGSITCALTTGTLPQGLTFNTNACSITGTPIQSGSFNLTITATDSATPTPTTVTTTGALVVNASPLVAGAAPANPQLNVAYTGQVNVTGGVQPYTFTITSGSLPSGIVMDSTGALSGTATAIGMSNYTVHVADSSATPQTLDIPLQMIVVYPTGTNTSMLNGQYAFLFQGYDDAVSGVLAYHTASAGSFTADGAGALTMGEMDANHQISTSTQNTLATKQFVGTYQINNDQRGLMTLIVLKDDGTQDSTITYSIAVATPPTGQTVSQRASIIQFDDNTLISGTRGSGSILKQDTTAIATGMNGSYAFGLSGDTPCLPTCTIGVIAGPAAQVGVLTTSSGNLSGTTDAKIASGSTYASNTLSGSYSTADGNGRQAVSMSFTNAPTGVYPADFAVYTVDANHAFVLSTDKHSTYILMAGEMEKQSAATFSNSSMTGAFVGYENSLPNPGLLGVTLQNVLNLSTVHAFRSTATADGNCNITNADSGGTTSLVSGLTSFLGSVIGLSDLLGSYNNTGAVTCSVAANGRGNLTYPANTGLLDILLAGLGLPTGAPAPRTFYLSGTNRGWFLETGYAALGRFEAQTGSPFNSTTLNGTYTYGSSAPSSLVSTNATGTFVADGAGNATVTQDVSLGVGTINLVLPGSPTTTTYSAVDTTSGKFTFSGSSMLGYVVTPNRVVVFDTSAAATSPTLSIVEK